MEQRIWRMTQEDFDKEEQKYMASLLLGAVIAIPFPVFIVWIQNRQGMLSSLGSTVILEVITAVVLGIVMMMKGTLRIRRVRRAGHTIYAENGEGTMFLFRLTTPVLLKLTGFTLTGGKTRKEQSQDYHTLIEMSEKIKKKHYIEDFMRLNVGYTYGGSIVKVQKFQKQKDVSYMECIIRNVDGQCQTLRVEIPNSYPEYEELVKKLKTM